jgi:hypothetical protein
MLIILSTWSRLAIGMQGRSYNVEIEISSFEGVEHFKYLGTTLS